MGVKCILYRRTVLMHNGYNKMYVGTNSLIVTLYNLLLCIENDLIEFL